MIQKTLYGHVPVHIWTKDVDAKSEQQLLNTASLPCVFHHVAAMPDVHFGIGSTVGSVIATKHAVIPTAVGVDIGCGMMAAKLPFPASWLPDNLKSLRDEIEQAVPVGFNQHASPTADALEWTPMNDSGLLPDGVQSRMQKALCQLGTLGGGNHFIELCLDTEQQVWVMLHSGSRNIGNEVAKHHIETAKGLFGESLRDLADADLAFLSEGTVEFANYWRDLQWGQAYAKKNREIMMSRVIASLSVTIVDNRLLPIIPSMVVNCHHNYAEREHHYGTDVIITRKGAVKAGAGDLGIIPGSMGARSFIVRGRGCAESFHSCSHGAGRTMSRTQAKKQFTLDDVAEQTAGVECRKDAGVIDEIPAAYKDIATVMVNQSDLVEIVAELKQVLCVKG